MAETMDSKHEENLHALLRAATAVAVAVVCLFAKYQAHAIVIREHIHGARAHRTTHHFKQLNIINI